MFSWLVRSLSVSHSVHGGSGAGGTGGFSGGSAVKDPPARAGDPRGVGSPRVGKIPWRRTWQPAPVVFPRKSHGQGSLAGCSPWVRRVRLDSETKP